MELIKKHLISILCAVALIALFLPLLTITAESEYVTEGMSSTIRLFDAAFKGIGLLLVVGPLLLIASNYIAQLDKYKGILSIAIPIVCIVALIIVFISAKDGASVGANAMSGINEAVGVETETKITIGFGTILTAIAHIAIAIAGIMSNKNIFASKGNFAAVKENAGSFIENAQAKVSQVAQNVSSKATTTSSAPKRSSAHTDEVLALLEKLAKMKDDGILSEEEFNDKKRKLLEEI